jgi:DNA-binding NtrC family response regulator
MKVLIVDDDRAIRDYLMEIIESMGHSVVAVSSGYEAIDHIRQHGVNLAYIDINMPGIDGLQTLIRMREIDPKVSGVMITGSELERLENSPLQKGVYVGLTKPFTESQIKEINEAYENIKGPLEFVYDNPFALNLEKVYGSAILVADDEKSILDIVVNALESYGFQNIDVAYNGEEAIEIFNKSKHDLIITDIVMPRVSGMEILRHVKAISNSSQVIIITGNANKDTAIAAVRLGAYDYLEKPFDLDTLQRITKMAIERKLLIDRTDYIP